MVIGDDYEKELAPFQENNMNDCPKEYLKFFDGEDGCPGYYENPNAKWDWYEVGGRWKNMLKLKERGGDQARMEEIENWSGVSTFAVLLNGEWVERGEMGWWGIVTNEETDDSWESQIKDIKKRVNPTDIITIIDCHI